MKQEGNVGSMAATDTLQNGTFRFELTIAGNELEGYGLMHVMIRNSHPCCLNYG